MDTGKEDFNALYRPTFETYLTDIVGQKFDPPITFKLRPFSTLEVFPAMKHSEVGYAWLFERHVCLVDELLNF
jgi:hypothetical protein